MKGANSFETSWYETRITSGSPAATFVGNALRQHKLGAAAAASSAGRFGRGLFGGSGGCFGRGFGRGCRAQQAPHSR